MATVVRVSNGTAATGPAATSPAGSPAAASPGPAATSPASSASAPNGVTAQPGLAAQARTASVADATAAACRQLPVPALVASLDDSRVAALLALPPRADPDTVLTRLASALRPRLDAGDVIGAGSVVESVTAVQRSFLEADQVAEVAARTPTGLAFYRLPDLRLRGLLHLLRDDPRLQAFAERELAPLLRHDHAAGSQLVAALTAYLEAGGNKAEAAKRAHLARPTLYERLRQIEEVLGTSLEPAESRLSLHVALLALDAVSVSARDSRPAP
jgi:purine catabolism regulator